MYIGSSTMSGGSVGLAQQPIQPRVAGPFVSANQLQLPPGHFVHAGGHIHSALVSKFLPLDLSQSSAVYGLYAAAAAGASALHHPNNSAAIFNPFLQNPTVFRKSVAELGREDIATGDKNTNSHQTRTQLTVNGTEHRSNGEASALNGASERTKIENGRSTLHFSRASVVVDTRVPTESNASLLPKSNGVRIGKADYLGERGYTLNGNQQIVSSSTCDSDGSSSSASSSCRISTPLSGHGHLLDASNAGDDAFMAKSGTEESKDAAGSEDSTKMRSDKKRKGLVRDDAYWERRRKNNDAAKRSRDSRRRKRLKSEIERHRIVAFTTSSAITQSPLVANSDNNQNRMVIVSGDEDRLEKPPQLLLHLPAPSPLKLVPQNLSTALHIATSM
ncbi:basic region leucine zipper domain-containing protein [Ditylenchus destructor]|nr:basic region leucine zipper domain-containing protein [Ditylenchus destructor]